MIMMQDPRGDMPVFCDNCGWQGYIGQTKVALYLDFHNPTPVAEGGDGKNYRCPVCTLKVYEVRYPKIKLPYADKR